MSTPEPEIIPVIWTGRPDRLCLRRRLTVPGRNITMVIFISGTSGRHLHLDLGIDHFVRRTQSRIIIRGVMRQRSAVSIDGRISIHPRAAGSRAGLESRFLLLSGQAKVRVIPGLTVSQPEVSAGHSLAAGPPDEREIFYLMSRGMTRIQAVRLLVQGFWSEALALLPAALQPQVHRILKI